MPTWAESIGDTSIEDLDAPPRIIKVLLENGIKTLHDLEKRMLIRGNLLAFQGISRRDACRLLLKLYDQFRLFPIGETPPRRLWLRLRRVIIHQRYKLRDWLNSYRR